MNGRAKHTHIAARRLAAGLAVLAILLAAAGFSGWIFDSPTLRSILPGYASMKPKAAVGIAFAGLALLMVTAYSASAPWPRLIRRVAAVAIALLGGAGLVQYLAHVDLGIDQFLFRDPFTAAENFPGRLSRGTATGFLIFGFSMLFTFRPSAWSFWVGFALTAIGFWTSLFVCLGYMFDVQALYQSVWFGTIALHTALGLLMLFAGLMLAVPDRGWARIVMTDKFGGMVARRVLPLIAIVPIGVLWLAHQGADSGLYSKQVSEYVAAVALLIVLATLAIVMCGRLNVLDSHRRVMQGARQRALAEAVRMRHMAEVDPLTGLWNRRHFMAAADAEIAAARAKPAPLTMLMIDIDHFKRINDTHGHAGGDKALMLLAATIKDYTRKADCVARIGGEEFGVLLPGATRAIAKGIAERFCEQVARLAVFDGERRSFGFTVSVGLGEVTDADAAPEDLMARADAALYEAKRSGRNRVVVADAPERTAA